MQKKLLIIGKRHSGKMSLLQQLTGSTPEHLETNTEDSHAGLTHKFTIKNSYYETDVDVWVDEYEDINKTISEYRSDEAKEVREFLAAIIFTFREFDETEWKQWENYVENLEEDISVIAVQTEGGRNQNIPDNSILEYVVLEETGSNQYNESVGHQRVKEWLQCCDWQKEDEEETTTLISCSDNSTSNEDDSEMEDQEDDGLLAGDLQSFISRIQNLRDTDMSKSVKHKEAIGILKSLLGNDFDEKELINKSEDIN
ncbi:recombination protein Irc6 [Schizosaccharomyces japonicus yFS275]|uniref:Recombination protein Irc6 n=1 Tax=Schizosaccharomyces japonicus (strain yFS275 / FY16936) TaxID=402676 RepID=B6K8D3_SCHJY|nr:recombination protein Irc6 [Schizosaccharomyces japonicus yFS275]EEB09787.2 recombination protein Irc6 [Schizosaccharomyces japonicus yFS275]